MQSVSVCLDVIKPADFRWKNTYVSRIHAVRHVIYMYIFWSSLVKVQLPSFIIVEYVWQILGREEAFLIPSSMSSPKNVHPE